MFDLIIRYADVADGLGNPLHRVDVAVKDGRVAAIDRDLGQARETIDANRLVHAPGVIDVHTHYDAQLTWDSTASPPAAPRGANLRADAGAGVRGVDVPVDPIHSWSRNDERLRLHRTR
jgi:predicted amidohydrolase